jgi:hypothetical protein
MTKTHVNQLQKHMKHTYKRHIKLTKQHIKTNDKIKHKNKNNER